MHAGMQRVVKVQVQVDIAALLVCLLSLHTSWKQC
jgi:hypothetical protein